MCNRGIASSSRAIATFSILAIVFSITFTAHSHAVTAVAFSSDGRQLASYCSIDQNLRVWQLAGNALMGFLGSGPRCIRVVDGQDKDTKGTHVIGNNMRLVWRPSGEIFLHADGHDLLRLF